jgi:hypothetical protein
MTKDEEKIRLLIREAVKDGIDDALQKYGLDVKDPTSMQADMLYLRKSRTGSDEIIKWTKRSCLTAAITGLLIAIWQGFKHLINQP